MPAETFEELPPDEQAVISLLVRQGRTYGQVAGVLRLPESALRDRAHQALRRLAGDPPVELSSQEVDEIADYVLGQQPEDARIITFELLLDSDSGRAWARAAAGRIAPVARVPLPVIPEDDDVGIDGWAEPSSDPVDPDAQAPAPAQAGEPVGEQVAAAPFLGRWLVLAGALLVIAAVAIFIARSGGSSRPPVGPIPASAATATTAGASTGSTAAVGASGTATGAAGSKILRTIKLQAVSGAGSAAGVVAIVQTATGKVVAFEATNLPAAHGGHYLLWLYDSPSKIKALGRLASVTGGSVGPLEVALPADAASYRGFLVTLQPATAPTSAGAAVLLGTGSSPL